MQLSHSFARSQKPTASSGHHTKHTNGPRFHAEQAPAHYVAVHARNQRQRHHHWRSDFVESVGTSMMYKTSTARYADGVGYEFFVCGYGHNAVVEMPAPGPRVVPHGGNVGIIKVDFDDELCSERVDALREPELLARDQDMEALGRYVTISRLGRTTPARPRGPGKATHGVDRRCHESTLRVIIMRTLRRAGHLLLYFVYCALSPFHDRTPDELLALVHARSCCREITLQQTRDALAWLREMGFAVALGPGAPASMSPAMLANGVAGAYDTNVGRAIVDMLGNCFALPPGTRIHHAEDMEKCRARLRRTMHAYRTERLVHQFTRMEVSDAFDAGYVYPPLVRLVDIPCESLWQAPRSLMRSKNLRGYKTMLEHVILADVLRVHRLGVRGAHQRGTSVTPSTTPTPIAEVVPLSSEQDERMPRRHGPHRAMVHIIAKCSSLPNDLLEAALPRPTVSAWDTYARHDLNLVRAL